MAQLAARRSHNPKVASSILAGSRNLFAIFLRGGRPWPGARCGLQGWMAERSKALVLGTSLLGGVGSNPTPIIEYLFLLLIYFFFNLLTNSRVPDFQANWRSGSALGS